MSIFKRKFKVLVIIFTVLAMLLLYACSNDNDKDKETTSGTSKSSEKVTEETKKELYRIKLLPNQALVPVDTTEGTVIGDIIKEKFNIVIDNIKFSGNLREYLSTLLAAGTYPEVTTLEGEDIFGYFVDAEALVSIDPYLDGMPNFKEFYKVQIPYWRALSKDGKLYKWETLMPQESGVFYEDQDMLIRTDLLEAVGWPDLFRASDYIKFIKDALDKNPMTDNQKTIGMTLPGAESWGMDIIPYLFAKGDTPYSSSTIFRFSGVMWNEEEEVAEHYIGNPIIKESIRFFNEAYREGILDPELFTDTLDITTEKISSGRVIAAWYTSWVAASANPILIEAGHPERQYIQLPIIGDWSKGKPLSEIERFNRLETVRPTDGLGVTINAKYPERIFELLEFLCTDEAQILTQSGIEGIHYEVTEDNRRIPTEEYKQNKSNIEYLAKQGLKGAFNTIVYKLGYDKNGIALNVWNDPYIRDEFSLTDRIKQAYKDIGWDHSRDVYDQIMIPAQARSIMAITYELNSDIDFTRLKLLELRDRNFAKIILAESEEEFEQFHAEMVKEYESFGGQELVDEFNRKFNEIEGKVDNYR